MTVDKHDLQQLKVHLLNEVTNFSKNVSRVFVFLNHRWTFKDGSRIPDVTEIAKNTEDLINEAIAKFEDRFTIIRSGGIRVEIWEEDGDYLEGQISYEVETVAVAIGE